MTPAPKRIGEVLIEKGLIKPWQLDMALQLQRTNKAFLGAILVLKGWITEEALLTALADQFCLPFVRIAPEQADWAVATRYSPALTEQHVCLAISADQNSVTVAIANPLDAWAISEVEALAGTKRVNLVLATVKDIQAAYRYGQEQAAKRLKMPPRG